MTAETVRCYACGTRIPEDQAVRRKVDGERVDLCPDCEEGYQEAQGKRHRTIWIVAAVAVMLLVAFIALVFCVGGYLLVGDQ